MHDNNDKILEIKDLSIHYETHSGVVKAVNDLSLELTRGETLGLVGETGAGKTTAALGIMCLVPDPPGRVVSGEILFNGESLLKKSKSEMRKIRGNQISMIFQDPMTSLNPVISVGEQIAEVIRLHSKLSKIEAKVKAQDMLELVGIPAERYSEYPHQFSGGMKQRVVIAISLACNPALLIADEPTTALDVTIQAQILDLMTNLKEEFNTSMLLITHDLGVVAEVCDKVAVIYAGEIVEYGNLEDVFENTKHPYTKGLFNSIPDLDEEVNRLKPITGSMPDPAKLPPFCTFSLRCPDKTAECEKANPNLINVSGSHKVRCLQYKEKGE